jgi:hypothetical protein
MTATPNDSPSGIQHGADANAADGAATRADGAGNGLAAPRGSSEPSRTRNDHTSGESVGRTDTGNPGPTATNSGSPPDDTRGDADQAARGGHPGVTPGTGVAPAGRAANTTDSAGTNPGVTPGTGVAPAGRAADTTDSAGTNPGPAAGTTDNPGSADSTTGHAGTTTNPGGGDATRDGRGDRSPTTADDEDDEPNTDPDLVWSKPTWSAAAEVPNPPPYPIPPPPGRTNNTKLIVGLAALAAILMCGCVSALVLGAAFGRTIYENVRERNRDSGGLNEAVRDGDLEFRVTAVQCGVPQVGDSFATQPAIGQFCLVEMNVRNVGDEPATFSDEHQRAFGPDGDEFAADSAAGVLANPNQQIFLNKINPGNEVTGVVVYDIPPAASIARIELRAAADSTGALVRTG